MKLYAAEDASKAGSAAAGTETPAPGPKIEEID